MVHLVTQITQRDRNTSEDLQSMMPEVQGRNPALLNHFKAITVEQLSGPAFGAGHPTRKGRQRNLPISLDERYPKRSIQSQEPPSVSQRTWVVKGWLMDLKIALIFSFSAALGEVLARRALERTSKSALSSVPLTGSPCKGDLPLLPGLWLCFLAAHGKLSFCDQVADLLQVTGVPEGITQVLQPKYICIWPFFFFSFFSINNSKSCVFVPVCADSTRKKIPSVAVGSALHHCSNTVREDTWSFCLCPRAGKIYVFRHCTNVNSSWMIYSWTNHSFLPSQCPPSLCKLPVRTLYPRLCGQPSSPGDCLQKDHSLEWQLSVSTGYKRDKTQEDRASQLTLPVLCCFIWTSESLSTHC